MPLNIKDIAKIAGVSVATVSRVLNNSNLVKDDTSEKVNDVIAQIGYKPNAIARSLKVKSTKTIGIMIPDISSHFFPEVVRGIEDIANTYDYNIILCNTDLDREKEIRYLSVLSEKQVDGIIFMSNIVTEELNELFATLKIPVVLVATDYDKLPSVTIDNVVAAEHIVSYLINKGHTRIAMISGRKNDPIAGASRIKGYKNALIKSGIAFKEDLLVEGDYRFDSGYEGAKKLLSLKERPSAVFAACDEMAMGVVRALLDDGFKLPDELPIVGFDDIDMAEKTWPPLTTIAQPLYQMGATGMKLLTDMINGCEAAEKKVVLDFELIVRKSG